MQLQYVTSKDWQDLITRYPFVESFLLTRALRNEKIALQNELEANKFIHAGRMAWILSRLEDLKDVSTE